MISQKQIIEFAEKEGFVVTGRMLRHWSANDLIPVPEMIILGRGRGSESLYPDETERQVIAICKLLDRKHSLVEAGWNLWMSGFSVSPEIAKGLLHNELDNLRNFVDEIRNENGEISDYALNSIISPEDAPKKHGGKALYQPHGILRRISKKLGAQRGFPTLLYLISLVFVEPHSQDDPNFHREDRNIDQKIFTEAISEFLPLDILTSDTYSILAKMHKFVDPDNLEECLLDANDATLRAAYREISSVYGFLWASYSVLKMLFEGKLPVKSIEGGFEKLPANDQALCLLAWLSFRRDDKLYQGYTDLSKSFPILQVESVPPGFTQSLPNLEKRN